MGLANRVVVAEQLIPAAWEIAGKIKNKAPQVLKYSKQAMRKGEFSDDAVEWVKGIVAELAKMEDTKEAFAAVMEKRDPVFRGR